MPGFSGYYLASYLDFLGLTYITAGLERLILFLHPTIVVLLSAWWLKKPIRSHHFVALALSYGGIALVLTENLNFGGHAHEVVLGGTLVFASGVIYAFYLIGAGEIVGRIGAMRFTAYAMLVACVVCVLQFLATHDARALVVPAQVYWLTSAMAIISTVIPAWLMSEGIRLTGGDGGIGRTGGDDILRLLVPERAGHRNSNHRCRTGPGGGYAGQHQVYVTRSRNCNRRRREWRAGWARQTLKRKCITSPSLTSYSLPSSRIFPASLEPCSPL